jgi:hypothetical protein
MKRTFNLALSAFFLSALAFGQVTTNVVSAQRTDRGASRAATAPAAPDAPSTLPPVFGELLPRLKAKTKAPILLPGELPASIPEDEIKVNFVEASNDSDTLYTFTLVRGEDCGNACFVGDFSANVDDEETRPRVAADAYRLVTLARGVKGFYMPRMCGGSCTPPEIAWVYRGLIYSIQLNVRGGTPAQEKANMIRVANSAIEGGAR